MQGGRPLGFGLSGLRTFAPHASPEQPSFNAFVASTNHRSSPPCVRYRVDIDHRSSPGVVPHWAMAMEVSSQAPDLFGLRYIRVDWNYTTLRKPCRLSKFCKFPHARETRRRPSPRGVHGGRPSCRGQYRLLILDQLGCYERLKDMAGNYYLKIRDEAH